MAGCMTNLRNGFYQEEIPKDPRQTKEKHDAEGVLNTLDCIFPVFLIIVGTAFHSAFHVRRMNQLTAHKDEDNDVYNQNYTHWDEETSDLRPQLKEATGTYKT